jgi:hypothetical protein
LSWKHHRTEDTLLKYIYQLGASQTTTDSSNFVDSQIKNHFSSQQKINNVIFSITSRPKISNRYREWNELRALKFNLAKRL